MIFSSVAPGALLNKQSIPERNMNIGETILDSRSAILAPMAGVADRAFREICVGYGASYVVSEMVSAKGLVMGDRKSKRLLSLSGEEHPAAVQIFGDDPDIMAKAVPCCLEAKPQAIDINMGCPAPKTAFLFEEGGPRKRWKEHPQPRSGDN